MSTMHPPVLLPAQVKGGYVVAKCEDGSMVVRDVPIFVECSRGEMQFDRDWIASAVKSAQAAESEGYLPPLHIRHHEPSTDATDSVRPAGFFRITIAKLINFKGNPSLAVFADLVITDPIAQQLVMTNRLPYRSVEIFDVEKPGLNSLALLDHEAPFLELPMLVVKTVNGMAPIADATFRDPWAIQSGSGRDSFLAIFSRGSRTSILFRNDPEAVTMSDSPKDDAPAADAKSGPDIAAIVKMIGDGSISVADMAQITAAIAAQTSATMDKDKDSVPDSKDKPAAAPSPAGPSMKAAEASEIAVLMGRNTALEARLGAVEAERQRDIDIAGAMEELKARPLGSGLREKLTKFHADHGAKAFKDYVGSMVATFAALPTITAPAAGANADLSSVAMKYAKGGAGDVEMAVNFAREWKQLHGSGHTRLSEETYVANNMARRAAASLN